MGPVNEPQESLHSLSVCVSGPEADLWKPQWLMTSQSTGLDITDQEHALDLLVKLLQSQICYPTKKQMNRIAFVSISIIGGLWNFPIQETIIN